MKNATESREIALQELVEQKRLSFRNLEELWEWMEKNVVEKGKREIIRNPSVAFEEKVIVVTDRNKPKGVFISLKDAKKLPPEIQAFLFMALNIAGCKYFRT